MELREERYVSRVWRCGWIIKSHPLSLLQKPESGSLHLTARLYPVAIYETVRVVVNRANARVKKGISRPQKESISFIAGSLLQSDSEVKTEAKSVKWKTATVPSSLASVLGQSDD